MKLLTSQAYMQSLPQTKYRRELIDLALEVGAYLTGKPDGSEPITLVFSIDAWRKLDVALQEGLPKEKKDETSN